MSKIEVVRWRQIYKPSPAVLRGNLSAEGYEVMHWIDRPGTVYGIHKHEEDQAHWVISGELEIIPEKGGSYILKAGDRDFIPAQTWHTARVVGTEPVNYFVGKKPIVAAKPKRKRGRPKKNL